MPTFALQKFKHLEKTLSFCHKGIVIIKNSDIMWIKQRCCVFVDKKLNKRCESFNFFGEKLGKKKLKNDSILLMILCVLL